MVHLFQLIDVVVLPLQPPDVIHHPKRRERAALQPVQVIDGSYPMPAIPRVGE